MCSDIRVIGGSVEMKTKLVVAGILWRGNEFLAAQRPDGKPHAGYWEFPGGKVEKGEDLETALIREMQEELGVTPLVMKAWKTVRHVYNDSASLKDEGKKGGQADSSVGSFSAPLASVASPSAFAVEVHFYHVTEFDGEPTPHEGHGLAWMDRDIAVTYPFLEADRPLVATLPLEQPE